jgi:YbbR domain-containing protein
MAWHPFRNLGLKIAALALGTLLWFTVSGTQVERVVSGVPVYYRNVPAPLVITGDRINEVSVHLRGGEHVISRLVPGDLGLVVDLTDAHPGPSVLSLPAGQVEAPLGVEVTQVDPATAIVMLEESRTVRVPVKPAVTGRPAPGFAVGMVTVEPKEVAVSGGVSRLQATAFAFADRVSIEGAKDTVTAVVTLGVSDAELRLPEDRTARVTVTIVPIK